MKRHLLLGRKAMSNLDSILKRRDITLPTKVCLVKAMAFPVVIYGCESWIIKEAEHWRIDAFQLWCWRRLLRVPWTAGRPNQSILKGNQSWIFIGRTDIEAETPILWPPDVKNWLIGKDPDSGKDWRQEEKGTTEVEMVGWHHQRYGHEFERSPGAGDRQRSMPCYSPWDCKELDTTERLNWTEDGHSLSCAWSAHLSQILGSVMMPVLWAWHLILYGPPPHALSFQSPADAPLQLSWTQAVPLSGLWGIIASCAWKWCRDVEMISSCGCIPCELWRGRGWGLWLGNGQWKCLWRGKMLSLRWG